VVWVSEGKSVTTVGCFFEALGPEGTAPLKYVTEDMSAAYVDAVTTQAPEAQIVFDRFHVQRLVQDTLDEVQRPEVRALEGTEAQGLKKTRWAVPKSFWSLSAAEHRRPSTIQRTDRRLYRAYLLKTALADILGCKQVGVVHQKLTEWIIWAFRRLDGGAPSWQPGSTTPEPRASTAGSEPSLAAPTAATTPPASWLSSC